MRLLYIDNIDTWVKKFDTILLPGKKRLAVV